MRFLIPILSLLVLVHGQNTLSETLHSIPTNKNSYLSQQQVDAVKSYVRLASIAGCSRMRTGQLFKETRECSLTKLCTNFEHVKLVDKFDRSQTGDIGGFFGRDDKRKALIVSFQGTSTWNNGLTDVKFLQDEYPNVKGAFVHTGFLQAANAVKEYLYPKIKNETLKLGENFKNYEVEVIGHSLGGAIATLFTAELMNSGKQNIPNFNKEKVVLVTLGEPRVGNAEFVQFMNQQPILQKRITNRNDFVPFIPFEWSFFSFLPNYASRNFVIHAFDNGKVVHCVNANDQACEDDEGFFKNAGQDMLDMALMSGSFDHFEFKDVITGCPTGGSRTPKAIGEITLADAFLEQWKASKKNNKNPESNPPEKIGQKEESKNTE
ncbi:uncharacterized protein VTP21DRAFT_4455 [Calcarisporiella thermophila]|uniref:uncharacterized protein n=1 Tax=Calcarisporiella thermophila TaxID=911321 RepID=UPI0037420D90